MDRPTQLRTAATTSLLEIFRTGIPKRFNKEATILGSDVEPDGVYLIEQGHVKAYLIRDTGEEAVHAILGPGNIFPIIWAFKGARRGLFYEAVDSVLLWMLPVAQFRRITNSSLDTAQLLTSQLIEQLDMYIHRLNNLGYKRARDRIIYRLLVLALRFGVKRADGVLINVKLTQQDIAESINVARESVARELERLKAQHILSYDKRLIVIHDLEQLGLELSDSASVTLSTIKETLR
ncbi:MAG TPA: Crp/Fnr family transcriptional regulator [Candidatus Saccharimonadales bacterium]|nr:Crp/Fnr family transcriptional regulator [Candidatus Saccharimonadales bacterium]